MLAIVVAGGWYGCWQIGKCDIRCGPHSGSCIARSWRLGNTIRPIVVVRTAVIDPFSLHRIAGLGLALWKTVVARIVAICGTAQRTLHCDDACGILLAIGNGAVSVMAKRFSLHLSLRALPCGRGSVLGFWLAVVFAVPCWAQRPGFLAKRDPQHVRLLCYNVNWDAIFADDDPLNHKYRGHNGQGAFVRVLRVINPDVICIQEINPQRDVKDVLNILDRAVPIDPDNDERLWHGYLGRDNVIASRWPLTMKASETMPATGRGHAMALVDLPDATYPADLYVINAHLKSAGGEKNIARRQKHADAIMNWIRDARRPEGAITLPPRTPYLFCGDFNIYDNDHRRHHFTLLTGDILDEKTYGKDFLPDWDNTILGDVLPLHNGTGPQRWTWRDDTTGFNPGPLDRIIYTDSVLRVAHAYILNTATLSDQQLAACGLKRGDVALDLDKGIFDHVPMVVDFAFRKPADPSPAKADAAPADAN
jgi:endonuclease/exonuclease/phosphatase family metal-dependent hydrolase